MGCDLGPEPGTYRRGAVGSGISIVVRRGRRGGELAEGTSAGGLGSLFLISMTAGRRGLLAEIRQASRPCPRRAEGVRGVTTSDFGAGTR